MKWYVVFKGHCPGVYDNWAECAEQVSGFSGNLYKSYNTKDEAVDAYKKFMEYEMSAAMVRQAVQDGIGAAKGNKEERKNGAAITGKDFIIGSLVLLVLFQFYIIFG